MNKPLKTVSVKEILAAGGADNYAITKGIDTSKKRLSGRLKISRKEFEEALTQLREQKLKTR